MTPNPDPSMLKVHKVWQSKDKKILLQLALFSESRWQKVFLLVDVNQGSAGFKILPDKPDTFSAGLGGFAQVMRKYLDGATVLDVGRDSQTGDRWIFFPDFYLRLSAGKPPELSFISAQKETLVRMSSKGMFTKKKPYEGDVPRVLESLLPAFQLTHDSNKVEEEQEDENLPLLQRQVIRSLRRKLRTLKKSLHKVKGKAATDEQIAEVEKQASVLKRFSYLVKPGASSFKVPAELSGEAVDMEFGLAPHKTLGENMELLFERAKKMQTNISKSAELLEQNRKEMGDIEDALVKLQAAALSEAEVGKIVRLYQLKDPGAKVENLSQSEKRSSSKKPYVCFQVDDDVKILVGKSAGDNDLMTKRAAANDYWLHVQGMAGSHVVIPFVKRFREKLDDEVLRKAAILALHYSKCRTQKSGEVYYTQRQHLKKPKGMAPGQWQVMRGKSVRISYDDDELQAILQTKVI